MKLARQEYYINRIKDVLFIVVLGTRIISNSVTLLKVRIGVVLLVGPGGIGGDTNRQNT